MKILDPQSALLTTAEVHQFLRDTSVREKDKKVGAYESVNVVNYHSVRRDGEEFLIDVLKVEHYTSLALPQITTFPPVESFMPNLLSRLKKYDLTKSEVYSLVNLGVGLDKGNKISTNGDANGDVKKEVNGTNESAEEAEEMNESELGKSLFKVIVEEWEVRFPEPDGEDQIDEILAILKESTQGAQVDEVKNGT